MFNKRPAVKYREPVAAFVANQDAYLADLAHVAACNGKNFKKKSKNVSRLRQLSGVRRGAETSGASLECKLDMSVCGAT